jgi:solute carrier family 20 (sodium-dependent phosphate transporter)
LIPGLRALPLFYGVTIIVNVFSIFHDGPKSKSIYILINFGRISDMLTLISVLHFDKIPLWGAIALSGAIGLVVAGGVQCFLVPYLRKSILGEISRKN